MGLPAEMPVEISGQQVTIQEPSEENLYTALQKAVYLRPELKLL